jgi:exopolysaccharide biosynthesis polyprenyl glycosylphosphotransferase
VTVSTDREQEYPLVGERTRELLERRRRSTVKRRGWLVRRALLAADLIGITAAFALTEAVFSRSGDTVNPLSEFLLLLATLPAWVVLAKLLGLYDRDEERTDHSTADDLLGVFQLLTTGAWVVVVVLALAPPSLGNPTVGRIATFWWSGIFLVMLSRAVARAVCRRHVSYIQNTAILGAGEVGQQVAHKFLAHPEYGINVVGFVDEGSAGQRVDLAQVPLLGPPERLPELVRALDVERVVVAFPDQPPGETLELIRTLNSFEVQVDVVPQFSDVVGPGTDVYTVEGLPLWGLRPGTLSRSSLLLKRAFDIAITLPLLLLLLPFGAVAALAIRLDSPGPVFFRQWRRGAGDRLFRIWKFRTMVDGAESRREEVAHLNMHAANGGDARMFKAADDPRVTRVGRVLRRLSLDELPQLLNVLRGEMSLVGPRPLVLDEDEHVQRWARRRLDLRPGMTGLWQVLGRSQIPFDEMVKLDYLYVTTWSLRKDLQLLLRTIPVMFRRRGL